MSEGGYKIRNQTAVHFITFATVEWVDVFTRKDYRDIVLESIKHCQAKKGLTLHAWCIMSNHLHLIVATRENNLSDVLRDFKKFTSKQIIKAIEENKHESRREWMLELFKKSGEANSRNSEYQFWRQDNQPKNFIVLHLYFRNLVTFIIILLKQELLTNRKNIYIAVQEIINRQRNAGYWMLFLYDENSLSTVDLTARGAGGCLVGDISIASYNLYNCYLREDAEDYGQRGTQIRAECVDNNVTFFTSYPMYNTITGQIKFSSPERWNYPRVRGAGIYIPWETWFQTSTTTPITLDFGAINQMDPNDLTATNENGMDF